MIQRHIAAYVRKVAKGYPAVAITGPRQAGKTTLARALFPDHPYVSLENLDDREFALTDPRGFLAKYEQGAIFDEIQHCPDLCSYLQGVLDARSTRGRFILTGSQQFGVMSRITQSLAGRVALVHLLPFAYDEVYAAAPSLNQVLFAGLYPPVHDRQLDPGDWLAHYVQTYVERDVRQLLGVRDLNTFQKFVRLCAGRTGQLLNLSQLGTDAGITHNTAKAWLSILEASYLVFLLPPHHANFNKRLIKSPKLYFYDTGLAAYLLGIREPEQLETHPLRGALFETWVQAELRKMRFNHGHASDWYFWRDQEGLEVDALFDRGGDLIPVEIKTGTTLNADFFKGLTAWIKLAQPSKPLAYLIYGGTGNQVRQGIQVLGWKDLNQINPHLAK
ncbi:MAG: ATP-binding protein [Verrucomicrobiota bacterium]